MKIQGKTLGESDVGRRVRYIPNHANNDVGHADVEDGKITSWNEVNVFVDYGHGSHPATSPDNLIWGQHESITPNVDEVKIICGRWWYN